MSAGRLFLAVGPPSFGNPRQAGVSFPQQPMAVPMKRTEIFPFLVLFGFVTLISHPYPIWVGKEPHHYS